MNKNLSPLLCTLALALLPAAQARAQADEGWQWVSAPYLWGSSITTDLNEDAPPVGSETRFTDIISKLDLAFQMRVEGQGERFGAFGDFTYISLSDDNTGSSFSTDASLENTLVEAGGVWNVSPERYRGLDVLVGIRYIKADLDVDITPVDPAQPPVATGLEKSFTDGMAGVRYTAALSDRWNLITRVDGSWGQSDGTLNASLMAGYRMEKGSLLFGYRYLDMELGERGRSVDVTMHGPVVAFAFGL